MEFDQNLLVNFASIFATVLLLLVTSTTVFQRLKLRWPLKVNCWFCNNNTKIWRQQLNWWLCPFCEQYNGFSKSGDYAYSIPEQYKSSSNGVKRYCDASQSSETGKIAKSNLCKECSVQENWKLLKLSNFEPLQERNYEYEVKQFKHSLEEQYPLCTNCKTTVRNVLHKQSLWLAQYKMLFFKQKPIRTIVDNAKYSESIFRIISTIFDSTIAYNTDLLLLPIGGLFFQLCACWVTPAKRRSSDTLLAFLWIGIIVLVPFKELKLLRTNFNNTWFSLEYVTQYHVIMLFASIIGFINVKPRSYKSTLNKNMSFKKIETHARDTVSPDSCTTITNDNQNFDSKVSSDVTETTINGQTSLSSINGFAPLSMENTLPIRTTTPPNSLIYPETCTFSTSFNNNAYFNSPSPYKNGMSDNCLLNDSLSTLSTLSLSEEAPQYTVKIPKMFEKKVYNPKSSDLFKKLNNTSNKKYILSPPKLKSVMQASWVAGGYWQEGIDTPSLSRSSSQSSGFGSAGSNFAPSREPSVHEFDQCSVMSDATQSCYTSRQTSMGSLGSFCQQGSQYSFAEPKSPICSQVMRFTPNHAFSPQPLLLSQNYQGNNSIFTDQYLQGQRANVSDIKNPSEMRIFPSHTTIVTSPVWLPALLCGSLVLNIIVLCTTLLR